MPQTVNEKIALDVSDGTQMHVYVARPEGEGVYPGLLVFQEAFGVNSHIRDVTERFAREGFVTVAPELFHRTAPGFEGRYDDRAPVMTQIEALTDENLRADVRAAYEWLRGDSGVQPESISSIGFCMGGRVSFLANAALPLASAISFYGGGIAPDLLGEAHSLNAPMLFFWAGLDKNILPEQHGAVTGALDEAGKDYVNVVFSQADHGFFCNERAGYNPVAATQSWALTRAFLESHVRRGV